MRALIFCSVLALGCGAVPAQAAEGIGCPIKMLKPVDRSAIKREMMSEWEPDRDRPGRTAWKRAVARCAAQYRWNPKAKELAGQHVYSVLLLELIGDRLAAEGIDVAAIEQYLSQHPVSVSRRDDTLSAFPSSLRAAGIKISAGEEQLVWGFAAEWYHMQQGRETFAKA